VTLARTLEIEKDTHHDIMAMVKAISEQSPEFGGFVHLGATSQDINDTVLALQLTECKVSRPPGRTPHGGVLVCCCVPTPRSPTMPWYVPLGRRCCCRRAMR